MRGRRRRVLSELFVPQAPLPEFFPRQHLLPIIFQEEYLRKNRFIVSLFSDNETIPPERIRGFKMEKISGEQTVVIYSTLMWSEWVDTYERVSVIQIRLYDSACMEKKFLDLDVVFLSYQVEGDHRSEDLMQPSFRYKILE